MVTTEAPVVLVSATPAVIQNRMPQGYPWGILENFVPEGFNLGPQEALVIQTIVTPAPHVVHVAPAAPPSRSTWATLALVLIL